MSEEPSPPIPTHPKNGAALYFYLIDPFTEFIPRWEHVEQNQLLLLGMLINVLEAVVGIRALSSSGGKKDKIQTHRSYQMSKS